MRDPQTQKKTTGKTNRETKEGKKGKKQTQIGEAAKPKKASKNKPTAKKKYRGKEARKQDLTNAEKTKEKNQEDASEKTTIIIEDTQRDLGGKTGERNSQSPKSTVEAQEETSADRPETEKDKKVRMMEPEGKKQTR